MLTREDARRKVRALLATAAEGSGAFPAERETARRLAAELTAKHGLDKPAQEPRPRPFPGVTIQVNVNGFSAFYEGGTVFFNGTTFTTA